MKHPYEIGGILFTVAILSGIFGGLAYNDSFVGKTFVHTDPEFDKEWDRYYEDIKDNHPSYYDDVYKMQGDCKKNAYDLQDFYDCVNKP